MGGRAERADDGFGRCCGGGGEQRRGVSAGAGRGREGSGTDEKKGENLLKGWGWVRDKCSDQTCPKAYIANEYKQSANNHFRFGKPHDKVRS